MIIIIQADRKKDWQEAIRHTQSAVKCYIAKHNNVRPHRLTIRWESDKLACVFSKGNTDTIGYVI